MTYTGTQQERAAAQFTALVIAANAERLSILYESAQSTGELALMRGGAGYPHSRELARILGQWQPEVVFLDCADSENAEVCAQQIRTSAPLTLIVGVGRRTIPQGPEFAVAYPPSAQELSAALYRGMHALRGERENGLLAFVPAKAGCGASTLVLGAASALAAQGKRVLVVDTDLYSGALGVMIETSAGHSLQNLLRGISGLDRFRLEEAVCETHGFHLLASDGTAVHPLPDWKDYFRLIDVARNLYDFIVVDLPEVINPSTREFVRRASGVYVVTTGEMVPLKLAARRLQELSDWGVDSQILQVVANRRQRGDTDSKLMAEVIGRPIAFDVPNDYRAVQKALQNGTPITTDNALGRAMRDFAIAAIGGPRKTGLLSKLFGSR